MWLTQQGSRFSRIPRTTPARTTRWLAGWTSWRTRFRWNMTGRRRSCSGGTILFGTDVGYTQLYDTTSEYEYMLRAGMNFRDILASLTTAPATYFKAGKTGRVVKGDAADLIVLDGDPATDVRNFAKVDYTIRAGKVIYKK